MGCSGQYGALPSRFRESLHDVPALRWRTRSNLDSSDMQAGGAARARSDSRGRERRGSSASWRGPAHRGLLHSGLQLGAKHLERCLVGPRAGTYDQVGSQCRHERKNLAPNDFPKSSLETIALHDGALVLRNDDADPWMMQKGSEDPNLEVFGSSSLPFAKDFLQIRPPSQSQPTGVGSVLRRRRTWLGAER
jgi:hypothetical protein